jgi:hypothetical protein
MYVEDIAEIRKRLYSPLVFFQGKLGTVRSVGIGTCIRFFPPSFLYLKNSTSTLIQT